MRICKVYARMDGSIAHIWDADYGTPEPGTNLVLQFDIELYPEIYATLCRDSELLRWQNQELLVGESVLLDSIWIARVMQGTEAAHEVLSQAAEMKGQMAAIRSIQLKILGYLQTWGNHASDFALADLDALYADLKAELLASEYWSRRLQLLLKRRGLAAGLSVTESAALLQRFSSATESTQDKALIWETAEILVMQATSLLLA